MDRQELEQEILGKKLTHPRVTKESIDSLCCNPPLYHVFPDTSVTVCCLKLKNGFCVTGVSASASMENFDRELGEKIALNKAKDRIWELEGYSLRSILAETEGHE